MTTQNIAVIKVYLSGDSKFQLIAGDQLDLANWLIENQDMHNGFERCVFYNRHNTKAKKCIVAESYNADEKTYVYPVDPTGKNVLQNMEKLQTKFQCEVIFEMLDILYLKSKSEAVAEHFNIRLSFQNEQSKLLKDYRFEHRISQTKLADFMNANMKTLEKPMTQTSISEIERSIKFLSAKETEEAKSILIK